MNKGCPGGLIQEFSWITILVGFSVNVKEGMLTWKATPCHFGLAACFQVRLGALKTAVAHDANN